MLVLCHHPPPQSWEGGNLAGYSSVIQLMPKSLPRYPSAFFSARPLIGCIVPCTRVPSTADGAKPKKKLDANPPHINSLPN